MQEMRKIDVSFPFYPTLDKIIHHHDTSRQSLTPAA
jgi:hypothetical protein